MRLLYEFKPYKLQKRKYLHLFGLTFSLIRSVASCVPWLAGVLQEARAFVGLPSSGAHWSSGRAIGYSSRGSVQARGAGISVGEKGRT